MDKNFRISDRVKSFRFAFRGLQWTFQKEHNMRIHGLAAFFALGLSFYLQITKEEWMWILLSIFLVMASEIINTAIEKLSDHIHPEKHPSIGLVKDLSAAAVLLFSIFAALIGSLIFIPYFCN